MAGGTSRRITVNDAWTLTRNDARSGYTLTTNNGEVYNIGPIEFMTGLGEYGFDERQIQNLQRIGNALNYGEKTKIEPPTISQEQQIVNHLIDQIQQNYSGGAANETVTIGWNARGGLQISLPDGSGRQLSPIEYQMMSQADKTELLAGLGYSEAQIPGIQNQIDTLIQGGKSATIEVDTPDLTHYSTPQIQDDNTHTVRMIGRSTIEMETSTGSVITLQKGNLDDNDFVESMKRSYDLNDADIDNIKSLHKFNPGPIEIGGHEDHSSLQAAPETVLATWDQDPAACSTINVDINCIHEGTATLTAAETPVFAEVASGETAVMRDDPQKPVDFTPAPAQNTPGLDNMVAQLSGNSPSLTNNGLA